MVDATQPIWQTETCPNCGAALAGEFCQSCGQKRIHRHDFALRHFFNHVIHEFTHLDSNKILRTFATLLFRPGRLTAEYLAGRKGSYINPVRIYLTFSAIYFLFAWSALSDIRGGGAARTARSQATISMARQKGVEPLALAQKIYQKAEKYAAALRFGSVLVSGLFLTLLFYSTGRYYVEHLVFSLHFYSFDFFFKSVFALVFIVGGALERPPPARFLDFFYPIIFVYLALALRRAYQQGWLITLGKAVVLFVLETLLFIGINIAGFMIAFSFA